MPSELHAAYVMLGARWFRRRGFGVVATELTVQGCSEQADVIGFRSSCSSVIEVKVSRADFRADRQKPHRHEGGLGNYRFMLCPEGLIGADELPAKWGLLHVRGRQVIEVVRPRGNVWPSAQYVESVGGDWEAFWHPSSELDERRVLYSIARRAAVVGGGEAGGSEGGRPHNRRLG